MSDKNGITYCKRTKCAFCKKQPDTDHLICIKRYKNLDEDGKCYSYQRTV